MVQVEPIGTIGHADRLSTRPGERVFGALGVVDDQLVFSGHRSGMLDFAVPLESLRWVGLRTRVKTAWSRRIETPELIVHADHDRRWRVYAFIEGTLAAFASQLGDMAGLPVHEMGEVFEDFGPAPAIRLARDPRHGWVSDRPDQPDPYNLPGRWDEEAGSLYLAPDRLLFNGTGAIPLAHIQEVAVYERGAAPEKNPFAENMLCVSYEDDGGATHTNAFLVRNAGDWAGVIETRADVPVTVHSGVENRSDQ